MAGARAAVLLLALLFVARAHATTFRATGVVNVAQDVKLLSHDAECRVTDVPHNCLTSAECDARLELGANANGWLCDQSRFNVYNGTCVRVCDTLDNWGAYLDCDEDVRVADAGVNGCETHPSNPLRCGACDRRCDDLSVSAGKVCPDTSSQYTADLPTQAAGYVCCGDGACCCQWEGYCAQSDASAATGDADAAFVCQPILVGYELWSVESVNHTFMSANGEYTLEDNINYGQPLRHGFLRTTAQDYGEEVFSLARIAADLNRTSAGQCFGAGDVNAVRFWTHLTSSFTRTDTHKNVSETDPSLHNYFNQLAIELQVLSTAELRVFAGSMKSAKAYVPFNNDPLAFPQDRFWRKVPLETLQWGEGFREAEPPTSSRASNPLEEGRMPVFPVMIELAFPCDHDAATATDPLFDVQWRDLEELNSNSAGVEPARPITFEATELDASVAPVARCVDAQLCVAAADDAQLPSIRGKDFIEAFSARPQPRPFCEESGVRYFSRATSVDGGAQAMFFNVESGEVTTLGALPGPLDNSEFLAFSTDESRINYVAMTTYNPISNYYEDGVPTLTTPKPDPPPPTQQFDNYEGAGGSSDVQTESFFSGASLLCQTNEVGTPVCKDEIPIAAARHPHTGLVYLVVRDTCQDIDLSAFSPTPSCAAQGRTNGDLKIMVTDGAHAVRNVQPLGFEPIVVSDLIDAQLSGPDFPDAILHPPFFAPDERGVLPPRPFFSEWNDTSAASLSLNHVHAKAHIVALSDSLADRNVTDKDLRGQDKYSLFVLVSRNVDGESFLFRFDLEDAEGPDQAAEDSIALDYGAASPNNIRPTVSTSTSLAATDGQPRLVWWQNLNQRFSISSDFEFQGLAWHPTEQQLWVSTMRQTSAGTSQLWVFEPDGARAEIVEVDNSADDSTTEGCHRPLGRITIDVDHPDVIYGVESGCGAVVGYRHASPTELTRLDFQELTQTYSRFRRPSNPTECLTHTASPTPTLSTGSPTPPSSVPSPGVISISPPSGAIGIGQFTLGGEFECIPGSLSVAISYEVTINGVSGSTTLSGTVPAGSSVSPGTLIDSAQTIFATSYIEDASAATFEITFTTTAGIGGSCSFTPSAAPTYYPPSFFFTTCDRDREDQRFAWIEDDTRAYRVRAQTASANVLSASSANANTFLTRTASPTAAETMFWHPTGTWTESTNRYCVHTAYGWARWVECDTNSDVQSRPQLEQVDTVHEIEYHPFFRDLWYSQEQVAFGQAITTNPPRNTMTRFCTPSCFSECDLNCDNFCTSGTCCTGAGACAGEDFCDTCCTSATDTCGLPSGPASAQTTAFCTNCCTGPTTAECEGGNYCTDCCTSPSDPNCNNVDFEFCDTCCTSSNCQGLDYCATCCDAPGATCGGEPDLDSDGRLAEYCGSCCTQNATCGEDYCGHCCTSASDPNCGSDAYCGVCVLSSDTAEFCADCCTNTTSGNSCDEGSGPSLPSDYFCDNCCADASCLGFCGDCCTSLGNCPSNDFCGDCCSSPSDVCGGAGSTVFCSSCCNSPSQVGDNCTLAEFCGDCCVSLGGSCSDEDYCDNCCATSGSCTTVPADYCGDGAAPGCCAIPTPSAYSVCTYSEFCTNCCDGSAGTCDGGMDFCDDCCQSPTDGNCTTTEWCDNCCNDPADCNGGVLADFCTNCCTSNTTCPASGSSTGAEVYCDNCCSSLGNCTGNDYCDTCCLPDDRCYCTSCCTAASCPALDFCNGCCTSYEDCASYCVDCCNDSSCSDYCGECCQSDREYGLTTANNPNLCTDITTFCGDCCPNSTSCEGGDYCTDCCNATFCPGASAYCTAAGDSTGCCEQGMCTSFCDDCCTSSSSCPVGDFCTSNGIGCCGESGCSEYCTACCSPDSEPGTASCSNEDDGGSYCSECCTSPLDTCDQTSNSYCGSQCCADHSTCFGSFCPTCCNTSIPSGGLNGFDDLGGCPVELYCGGGTNVIDRCCASNATCSDYCTTCCASPSTSNSDNCPANDYCSECCTSPGNCAGSDYCGAPGESETSCCYQQNVTATCGSGSSDYCTDCCRDADDCASGGSNAAEQRETYCNECCSSPSSGACTSGDGMFCDSCCSSSSDACGELSWARDATAALETYCDHCCTSLSGCIGSDYCSDCCTSDSDSNCGSTPYCADLGVTNDACCFENGTGCAGMDWCSDCCSNPDEPCGSSGTRADFCSACCSASSCPGGEFCEHCCAASSDYCDGGGVGTYCDNCCTSISGCLSSGANDYCDTCCTSSSAAGCSSADPFCPTSSGDDACCEDSNNCNGGDYCVDCCTAIDSGACPGENFCDDSGGCCTASSCVGGTYCGTNSALQCCTPDSCPAADFCTECCTSATSCQGGSVDTELVRFCDNCCDAGDCGASDYCDTCCNSTTFCSDGDYCQACCTAADNCPAGDYCTSCCTDSASGDCTSTTDYCNDCCLSISNCPGTEAYCDTCCTGPNDVCGDNNPTPANPSAFVPCDDPSTPNISAVCSYCRDCCVTDACTDYCDPTVCAVARCRTDCGTYDAATDTDSDGVGYRCGECGCSDPLLDSDIFGFSCFTAVCSEPGCNPSNPKCSFGSTGRRDDEQSGDAEFDAAVASFRKRLASTTAADFATTSEWQAFGLEMQAEARALYERGTGRRADEPL